MFVSQQRLTLYQTVVVFREDRALQVAVRSSPLSMNSESLGTTTAGSKSAHNQTKPLGSRTTFIADYCCVRASYSAQKAAFLL